MDMKGFYFSLDALTASMVLLAVTGMLASYTPQPSLERKPVQLDKLHTAAIQKVENWNSSYSTDNKVLTEIYVQEYSGNKSEAESICRNYFNISEYALYFSNSTDTHRACGNLVVQNESSLETRQAVVPDVKVNGSFIGPKNAVMVVKD